MAMSYKKTQPNPLKDVWITAGIFSSQVIFCMKNEVIYGKITVL